MNPEAEQPELPLDDLQRWRDTLDDLQRWRAKHATELARGKHYIERKGYAAAPGTGPAGETCRSCLHARRMKNGRQYWKCALMERLWRHSRRTDILATAPACSKWEKLP